MNRSEGWSCRMPDGRHFTSVSWFFLPRNSLDRNATFAPTVVQEVVQ